MARRDVVLTYEEYAALPADGRRYEIHDGELSVTRAPSPQHQMIIGTSSRSFVRTSGRRASARCSCRRWT